MKKAVFAMVLALAAGLTAQVSASHFVMIQQEKVSTPQNSVDAVNFKEGKKTVRFMWSNFGNDYSILATSKPNWLLQSDTYWSYKPTAPDFKGRPGYIITQYQDTDTGRYFYAVEDLRYMEAFKRSFLLGFDDQQKKFITYIDSDSLDRPKGSNAVFFDRKGGLFIGINAEGDNPAHQRVYKLDWSEDTKWFGYEYIDNLRDTQYW